MPKKKPYDVTPAKKTREWMREDDLDLICRAWENYAGSVEVIEGAIGALMIGRLAGYNALRILHSWKTLKNYERILGIEFAKELEAETADTRRINGIRYADNFKAFWKALAAGVSSEKGAREVGKAVSPATE